MLTWIQKHPERGRVTWMSVGLAVLAAVAYVLIGRRVLGVGDLDTKDAPATITYVAAGCYLAGGLLILLHRRGLWIAGAVINALVMLMFFSAYAGRPAVLFSPGGLITKAAELLLEAGLLYLIITTRRRAPRASRGRVGAGAANIRR
jgi:hypothetical protein